MKVVMSLLAASLLASALSGCLRVAPVADAEAGPPDVMAAETDAMPPPDASPRRGLLGWLNRNDPADGAETPEAETASVPAVSAASEPVRETGLFRRRAGDETAAAPVDVAGLRALCGDAARGLARPTDNASGFRLHDVAPNSVNARAVQISGFADGCAREVKGAVVLFGQPALYELTRSAARQNYVGPTDAAYDALKARVCGGAALCPALQQRAVFVTAHDKAGDDRRWLQVLLADGAVLASEVKTR